ncbi:MAG TPA: divalent-cation tolerance protein CutA [Candidatus Acidoferrales bacterium]|nr:divalent-cation tolerance protein CutA [Candidatus Acidoferrales bacterium]
MKEIVVLVTCASPKEAERLAESLLHKRLAACVNIASGSVKSIYRWKGKVEAATEIPMVIKTTRRKFAALETEIRRLHSYDTPEIIALPILAGSAPYMKWIEEAVSDSSEKNRSK